MSFLSITERAVRQIFPNDVNERVWQSHTTALAISKKMAALSLRIDSRTNCSVLLAGELGLWTSGEIESRTVH